MLIVKLGGSVLQNSLTEMNPNIPLLIKKFEAIDDQVVITMGGGKLCRLYQEGLRLNGVEEVYPQHDLGKESCNFQAEYLRWIFPRDKTFPVVIKGDLVPRSHFYGSNFKYYICGAWSPGKSSDFNAALVAKEFQSTTLLRISNIDYVYDDDPRTNPNAKKCDRITWDEYLDIIGNISVHNPGASYPVDPIAARFARENKIRYHFTSFDKFIQMDSIDFESFDGTVIG